MSCSLSKQILPSFNPFAGRTTHFQTPEGGLKQECVSVSSDTSLFNILVLTVSVLTFLLLSLVNRHLWEEKEQN